MFVLPTIHLWCQGVFFMFDIFLPKSKVADFDYLLNQKEIYREKKG